MGLIALFAFITAYDSWAMANNRRTITAEFRDSFEKHPIQTSLGAGYVLAHLYNWPRHFKHVDAFEKYAWLFAYIAGKVVDRAEEIVNDAVD